MRESPESQRWRGSSLKPKLYFIIVAPPPVHRSTSGPPDAASSQRSAPFHLCGVLYKLYRIAMAGAKGMLLEAWQDLTRVEGCQRRSLKQELEKHQPGSSPMFGGLVHADEPAGIQQPLTRGGAGVLDSLARKMLFEGFEALQVASLAWAFSRSGLPRQRSLGVAPVWQPGEQALEPGSSQWRSASLERLPLPPQANLPYSSSREITSRTRSGCRCCR